MSDTYPFPEPQVLNRAEVRRVDRIAIDGFGIPGILLMENAGRGVVEQILHRFRPTEIVICCGPGNNGGDGFVMARHLHNRGIMVKILLACDALNYQGDAKINFEIARKMGIGMVPLEAWGSNPEQELAHLTTTENTLIVDALLGTGATGPARPPMDDLIRAMNDSPAIRIAVDIPTGMDCDSGRCHSPTVRADVTCTFVALKPAFQSLEASKYHGEVIVIDIGAPRDAIKMAVENQPE